MRLSGLEAPRRAPSTVLSVEDVLAVLLSNAREAGAENVYVASRLSARRYRTLVALDDGSGVPDSFAESIFAPGVTSKPDSPASGLSLHHVRAAALEARLCNQKDPTAFKVILDTRTLPERTLQSTSTRSKGPRRRSRTNLRATALDFARTHPDLALYLGTPAEVLARLLKDHIIQADGQKSGGSDRGGEEKKERGGGSVRRVAEAAGRLGFEVSGRTVSRVVRGEVAAAERIEWLEEGGRGGREARAGVGGVRLTLGAGERARIASILEGAARASYARLGEVRFESREGRVEIRAEVLQPEEEYDD